MADAHNLLMRQLLKTLEKLVSSAYVHVYTHARHHYEISYGTVERAARGVALPAAGVSLLARPGWHARRIFCRVRGACIRGAPMTMLLLNWIVAAD